MPVTYTFANATAAIPLSQLDSNFATPITIGNVAIQLGNTVTSLGNVTLANATVTNSTLGNVTITSVASTFPNNYLSNSSVTIGNTAVALGSSVTTLGNVTLTNATISSVASPITVAEGGTGLATITSNNVILGNGTGNLQVVAPGTSGNVLTSNGTTWLSQAASASTPTSIANGTSNVSVNSSGGNVTVTTAGTTVLTVNTSGAFGVGSSPSYGTSGQVLTSAGSGAAPTWSSPGAGAMTLISTQTISSGSSSFQWTGLSGYDKYLVILEDVYQSSSGNNISCSIGYGSTPTYIGSGYSTVITYLYNNSLNFLGNSSYGSIPIIGNGNGTGSTAGTGASGQMWFYGMNSGKYTRWYSTMYCLNGFAGELDTTSGTQTSNTSAKTAIQFIPGSGTFSNGTASLYGISS